MSKHRNEVKFEIKEEKYITSRGDVLTLRAVPPLLIPTITAAIKFPAVPTYEVETVTGDKEIHKHEVDEEKGVDTRKTPEDMEAWSKYIKERSEASNTLTENLMNAVLLEGVILPLEKIEMKKFKKKLEIMGLDFPDDDEDLIHMYKQLYIAASESDMTNILTIVMSLSGIEGEEVEASKKSFPDPMESRAQS
jgi:hypothetical protein